MYVCMYVCMYVFMYVCMYVCVCVYVCECVDFSRGYEDPLPHRACMGHLDPGSASNMVLPTQHPLAEVLSC